jgi:A/G-specific adenine glycosylase
LTLLPQKAVTWLLLRQQGQVLLEKRPAPGIWGGLWSFPEAPAKDVDGYCRRTLGCEVGSKKALDTLEHGFTHFRLKIRPLLCEVMRKPNIQAPGYLWVDVEQAGAAATPTPVRELVARLMGIPPAGSV